MPQILSNDFKKQWNDCGQEILAAINTVGESGWYILGKEVKAFEQSLAQVFSCSQAIGCANGMDGLEISLRALGLNAGAKVLTTPLSAFATTLAIARVGLRPVFVDVDKHGLIDLDLCEQALKQDSSIKCVMPVHLYGHCLDLKRLKEIKRAYNVHIIEDCAQSILASFEDIPCGTIGDLAATSFYPTKNLGALGDGGAILTNSSELSAQARVLRDYGQKEKYVHDALGLNSRLDEVHAAILHKVFLPRLKEWTRRRAAIAASYFDGICNKLVTPLPAPKGSNSCWHLFPVLIKPGARAAFQKHLNDAGISTTVHYPHLIPHQKAVTSSGNFEVRSSLETAEKIAENVISIPNHPYMTDDEVTFCIETINNWKFQ